ncbi:MAG: hypothetical protein NUV97_01225 [archaeon]|nr:hypothetical protein [archaeon]MCR4323416.1 hypothetical protein [Nanoarchaeota archaeon]
MSHKYIQKTSYLRFDPRILEGSDGRAFPRTARILWLGLTSKVLDTPKFRDECLELADDFKNGGVPRSPDELGRKLEEHRIRVVPEHLEELFPYIQEGRVPEYEIVEAKKK